MTSTRPAAIKLDQDMLHRIKRLAAAKGRSMQWMLRQAVAQFIEREESREVFRAAALEAWHQYQFTGLHVAHDDADAWLARLQAGEEAAVPQGHV